MIKVFVGVKYLTKYVSLTTIPLDGANEVLQFYEVVANIQYIVRYRIIYANLSTISMYR